MPAPRFAPVALALSLSVGVGCSDYGLAQEWQLDRLRLLAIRAEPAEARPGEVIRFSSLVYQPEGASIAGTAWFACLPEAADDFGCTADPGLMDQLAGADPSTLSDEDLAELNETLVAAGLIGYEPLFAPVWTAPVGALDGLDEAAAQEGLSALINVSVIPEGADSDGDIELAYKRVPISLSTTPNHNPELLGLRVALRTKGSEDASIEIVDDQSEVVEVRAGRQYQIDPLYSPASLESYVYVDEGGGAEERSEEPYFSWYTEGGEFDQPFSLYPSSGVVWTAPSAPWSGLVLVLMRDRRGGMAWRYLHVEVPG